MNDSAPCSESVELVGWVRLVWFGLVSWIELGQGTRGLLGLLPLI